MRFEIRLGREAERQLLALSANHRAMVRAAIETHLRHEPMKLSKSRIKRLRGLSRPQYRLRADDYRVFYDIEAQEVQVLAIISKAEGARWLETYGIPEAGGGAGEGER
jgi:mRNA interferase RelE/StbE